MGSGRTTATEAARESMQNPSSLWLEMLLGEPVYYGQQNLITLHALHEATVALLAIMLLEISRLH